MFSLTENRSYKFVEDHLYKYLQTSTPAYKYWGGRSLTRVFLTDVSHVVRATDVTPDSCIVVVILQLDTIIEVLGSKLMKIRYIDIIRKTSEYLHISFLNFSKGVFEVAGIESWLNFLTITITHSTTL